MFSRILGDSNFESTNFFLQNFFYLNIFWKKKKKIYGYKIRENMCSSNIITK